MSRLHFGTARMRQIPSKALQVFQAFRLFALLRWLISSFRAFDLDPDITPRFQRVNTLWTGSPNRKSKLEEWQSVFLFSLKFEKKIHWTVVRKVGWLLKTVMSSNNDPKRLYIISQEKKTTVKGSTHRTMVGATQTEQRDSSKTSEKATTRVEASGVSGQQPIKEWLAKKEVKAKMGLKAPFPLMDLSSTFALTVLLILR